MIQRLSPLLLLFVTLFTCNGCVNKRGISHRYYNECKEYYDLQGYYHKECDENLVEFDEEEPKRKPRGNIW